MNLHYFFPRSLRYIQNNNTIRVVNLSDFLKVVYFLQKHSRFKFEQLIDITAVDYINKQFRFELAYQFLSILSNKRIILVVSLIELQSFTSISSIYSSAEWYEREIWDIFGIYFINNKDLRRILTNYGFVGHPLRKDFPVSGFTCDLTK
jgi:NADH-quinone oxidoreductase subunit C